MENTIGYSTFDILRAMGLRIERIQDWINRGYVTPSIETAHGQGTKNVFSKDDLYRIQLFKSLVTHGFLRKDAARYFKAVSLDSQMLEGHDFLVLTHKDGSFSVNAIRLNQQSAINLDEEPNCDEMLVLNLSKVREEVEAAISGIGG